MIDIQGHRDIESSDDFVQYAQYGMAPYVESGANTHVVAREMFGKDFRRGRNYLHVTRQVDDAIVHDHDRHVLLMRSIDRIEDDTLICDHIEAVRALAKSAMEMDIAAKLRAADTRLNVPADELHDRLAIGFDMLAGGFDADDPKTMFIGRDALRRNLTGSAPQLLRSSVKYDLLRVLVRAQQGIPESHRSVIQWDAQSVDALLIGARVAHARSLLGVDTSTADKRALNIAFGTSTAYKPWRGLHFATFVSPESSK